MFILAAAEAADSALKVTVTLADILGFVCAPLLVLATGVVTKLSTSPAVKSTVLLLFSAVEGFAVEYLAGPGDFNLWIGLLKALGVFLVAVNAHFGFLKPTGLSEWVQANVGRKDDWTAVA